MVVYEWFERLLGERAGFPPPRTSPRHRASGTNGKGDGDAGSDVAYIEESPFWNKVAPDPNFTPNYEAYASSDAASAAAAGAPSTPTASSSGGGGGVEDGEVVECRYCHRMTPTSSTSARTESASGTPATSSKTAFPSFSSSLKKKRKNTPGIAVYEADDDDVNLAEETQEGLVEASKATLEVMQSPHLVHKRQKFSKFFRSVAEATLWNEKKRQYVAKMLASDDASCLFEARATHSDCASARYAYTPLQVAANNGNLEALDMFIEHLVNNTEPVKALQYLGLRNLEGQNALHIAAREGDMEAVEKLLNCSKTLQDKLQQRQQSGGVAPSSGPATADSVLRLLRSPTIEQQEDSMGHTPLAAGLLSPQKLARENSARLEALLKQPSDRALFGKPVHPGRRFRADSSLSLALSHAEIPGRRIHQEDAILVQLSSAGNPFALVGVFDGHGDCGLCSNFVAGALVERMYSLPSPQDASDPTVLRSTFLAVDAEVKESKLLGGSTGVVAVITPEKIVVANLGDSRAILVQQSSATTTDAATASSVDAAAHQLEQLSLSNGTPSSSHQDADPGVPKGSGESDATTSPETQVLSTPTVGTSTGLAVTVKPLSFDHAPNLETELKRIVAAGFQVEGNKLIRENNKLGDKDRLAMSRSFGDVEWKNNDNLQPEEQAVSASPDVLIHERSPNDSFLVLACDGIWDVMTNDEVGQFVAEKVKSGLEQDSILSHVADQLLEECLNRGSSDNMSVVIVALSDMANQVTSTPRRQLNYQLT